jgi:cell division protein FtsB
LVGLLALLQYQLWFGEGGIKERRALERQAAVGEDANATLRQRNDTLARQVLELQEGTEMLEAMAREELGLVREGEEYILFIDEKSKEQAP